MNIRHQKYYFSYKRTNILYDILEQIFCYLYF